MLDNVEKRRAVAQMVLKLRMTGFSRKLGMLNLESCMGRVVVCGGAYVIFREAEVGYVVSTKPRQ